MFGIVGYVGKQQAVQILLERLSGLEYRGYESVYMAIISTKYPRLSDFTQNCSNTNVQQHGMETINLIPVGRAKQSVNRTFG